jgi:hypothetical protein
MAAITPAAPLPITSTSVWISFNSVTPSVNHENLKEEQEIVSVRTIPEERINIAASHWTLDFGHEKQEPSRRGMRSAGARSFDNLLTDHRPHDLIPYSVCLFPRSLLLYGLTMFTGEV